MFNDDLLNQDPLESLLDPIKKCPGLEGIFCGLPRRKGQGYCPEHARQYQRNRYSTKKKQETGFAPRRYYRREGGEQVGVNTWNCNCCLQPKDELYSLPSVSDVPPICMTCVELINSLRTSKMFKNYLATAKFIIQHQTELTAADRASEALSTEFERRLAIHLLQESWPQADECRRMYKDMLNEFIDTDLRLGRYYYDPETQRIEKNTEIVYKDRYDPTKPIKPKGEWQQSDYERPEYAGKE